MDESFKLCSSLKFLDYEIDISGTILGAIHQQYQQHSGASVTSVILAGDLLSAVVHLLAVYCLAMHHPF